MIVGKQTKGATAYSLVADRKVAARFQVTAGGIYLPKLSIYVDGGGAGAGPSQVMKGVIYDAVTDKIIATSQEVAVLNDAVGAWVDLRFATLPALLIDGIYDFGIHLGGSDSVIRFYGDDPRGLGGRQNTDTYSDGPAATFGASTTLTSDLSLYATAIRAWEPPPAEDIYYAQLPFLEAQVKLGKDSPLPNPKYLAVVGWHGTKLDGERGSVAIVQTGGRLRDLVGERVKVTVREGMRTRSVVGFVHNEAELYDDTEISLPRRSFMALGNLALDSLKGTVEVIL